MWVDRRIFTVRKQVNHQATEYLKTMPEQVRPTRILRPRSGQDPLQKIVLEWEVRDLAVWDETLQAWSSSPEGTAWMQGWLDLAVDPSVHELYRLV